VGIRNIIVICKEAEEDKEQLTFLHPFRVKMKEMERRRWKHTFPIAMKENAWKAKARTANTRRWSSGGSESDAKLTFDRLRIDHKCHSEP
jgi:hypothetical protein